MKPKRRTAANVLLLFLVLELAFALAKFTGLVPWSWWWLLIAPALVLLALVLFVTVLVWRSDIWREE